ncbi:MAG: LOG family protein [Bacilli bacterium]|nr:LOG family protein [Bacilli bacterium]
MRIFVGCSTSSVVPIKYRDLASEIATMLTRNNHKLVFGGPQSGMMGKCYMTFKYEEAKTKAVLDISEVSVLEDVEVDASKVSPSTFQKRENIYVSSELILILPGEIGTLAELFSIMDEKIKKHSNIPIVLFNFDNFYTPLINFLKDMESDGFINESHLNTIDIVTDVKSLEMYISRIESEKKEN